MWKPIRSAMASTESDVLSSSSCPRRSRSLTSQSTTVILNRRSRCILTNLEERALLDLLPGRQQDAVIKRLMNMTNRHNVEIVSMDMWKANQRRTLNGDRRILLKRAHDVSDRERLIIETGQGPSHSSW